MIRARVIADSINPAGDRLTTVEATFNRYILAELNTHRKFSRNSASSRAIPVTQVMRQVLLDPSLPISWGTNQAGMQARVELAGWRRGMAQRLFRWGRFPILIVVWLLTKVKLHKQVANRLLEPWVWHTAVISATDWDNFFTLRLHPDAQPEFQELARCIKQARDESVPQRLEWGGWHLPYVEPQDYMIAASSEVVVPEEFLGAPLLAAVSAARCARVSYVRQNERREPGKDVTFIDGLRKAGHWSPFEHAAIASQLSPPSNFRGWRQLRKFFAGEEGENRE